MKNSTLPQSIAQQIESRKNELKECKKTKALLQQSEFKYRSLVESANEAMLVAQNGIFKFSNPKAEELFGYSQKEIASKPLSDFIHKNDSEMVMQRHERRIKGDSLPEVYPFRIVNKEGTTIWVELKVKLFSWNILDGSQSLNRCLLTFGHKNGWINLT